MRYQELVLTLGVLAPFTLSACGASQASARVAARVNDHPIAVEELAQLPAPPAAGDADTDQGARLQRLIDLQLLVQEARRLKLEQDPAVSARIDVATKAILAQAYVDKAAQQSAAPSEADIDAYYRDHPESFARRRVYLLRELTVQMAPQRFAELRQHSVQARDLKPLEHWLRGQHIAFVQTERARTSDQIPPQITPAFLRLKRGDIGVARIPQGAWVLQVLDWVSSPLSLSSARPLIARYLALRQRMAVEEAEVQRLRDGARIEYLGRFASHRPVDTAAAAPGFADSREALSMVHTMRMVTGHE
ncbi:MAG: EpsD family peptidyl-prolyl cis-trans isomerase [Steroidobacteraceae bacterium]